MRCWIPTAMRSAYAQEKLLMVEQDPDVRAIERMLTFYGHTIGAGPCWPDHLTRETTVEHNRQLPGAAGRLAPGEDRLAGGQAGGASRRRGGRDGTRGIIFSW